MDGSSHANHDTPGGTQVNIRRSCADRTATCKFRGMI
jgi:hypothetical protein